LLPHLSLHIPCSDDRHPGGANGHRLLFDLVASVLIRSSHSLLSRAYNADREDAVVMEPLPPPMFKGNYQVRFAIGLVMNKGLEMMETDCFS
jgi:hypothetical protein